MTEKSQSRPGVRNGGENRTPKVSIPITLRLRPNSRKRQGLGREMSFKTQIERVYHFATPFRCPANEFAARKSENRQFSHKKKKSAGEDWTGKRFSRKAARFEACKPENPGTAARRFSSRSASKTQLAAGGKSGNPQTPAPDGKTLIGTRNRRRKPASEILRFGSERDERNGGGTRTRFCVVKR